MGRLNRTSVLDATALPLLEYGCSPLYVGVNRGREHSP